LLSLYNIFKVFTVEGWFEIPDAIMAKTGTSLGIVTKLYFVVLLMTGGVLGLSLVNSIFVDAMVMDNHESLERKIAELNSKLDRILAAKGLLSDEAEAPNAADKETTGPR
jgi:voltage-gated sodium channel